MIIQLLDRDYDDIRRFSDAAGAGMKRALAAGAKKPLLKVLNNQKPVFT